MGKLVCRIGISTSVNHWIILWRVRDIAVYFDRINFLRAELKARAVHCSVEEKSGVWPDALGHFRSEVYYEVNVDYIVEFVVCGGRVTTVRRNYQDTNFSIEIYMLFLFCCNIKIFWSFNIITDLKYLLRCEKYLNWPVGI